MKRILTSAAALLLAVMCAVSIISCDDKDGNKDTGKVSDTGGNGGGSGDNGGGITTPDIGTGTNSDDNNGGGNGGNGGGNNGGNNGGGDNGNADSDTRGM